MSFDDDPPDLELPGMPPKWLAVGFLGVSFVAGVLACVWTGMEFVKTIRRKKIA